MSFQTLGFALFFPVVSGLYFILPAGKDNRIRNIWLLIAGYFFYMYGNPMYGIFLLYITAVTYIFGLHYGERGKGGIHAAVPVLLTLLPFLTLKYTGFIVRNLNLVSSRFSMDPLTAPDLILPVGISFYSFAALSYVLDVRSGKIKPERDVADYMLFVSFFPAILSGPIERAGHLIPQFKKKHYFDPDRVKNGVLLMIWGYFLKLVLSERIAVFVNTVYGEADKYTGILCITAILLYSLQIYFDFASYSYIALGTGEVMGFELINNFERPFLAQSISDLWRRWHISLTSFFRDYVYIPLGGKKKGNVRKYFNIMTVFLLSGLWHGASWNYVFWGGINGFFQIAGEILKPLRKKTSEVLEIREGSFGHRCYRTIATFLLFSFSVNFFRSESLISAIRMLRNCFVYNPWKIFDGSLLSFGLKWNDYLIILLSLLLVLSVSILNERGIRIRERIDRQDTWFRWVVYISAIMAVLIFGMYGPGYDASEFIYFKF